ncbi:hypothetical protein D1823_13215 [Ruegeria sp. AD91A]|nr:hypothetical protein D1823_13215 [Ruegeria sp. AD91A]
MFRLSGGKGSSLVIDAAPTISADVACGQDTGSQIDILHLGKFWYTAAYKHKVPVLLSARCIS